MLSRQRLQTTKRLIALAIAVLLAQALSLALVFTPVPGAYAADHTAAGTGSGTAVETVVDNTGTSMQILMATHTVSFNANGKNNVSGMPSQKTVSYNNTITKPTDPTLAGYRFDGWYKETGCTNAFTFGSDKITANTTLYAKWTPKNNTLTLETVGTNVTTTFEQDSGTATNWTSPATKTVPYGSLVTIDATLSSSDKTGYVIAWEYTGLSGTGSNPGNINQQTTNESAGTGQFKFYMPDGNVKITVVKTEKASTIEFMPKWVSGGGVTTDTTVTNMPAGIAGKTGQTISDAFPTAVPTKLGYTFAGWVASDGTTKVTKYPSEFSAGATRYYATWTAASASVKFVYNNGTNPTTYTGTTGASTSFSWPANPTRSGYTFDGWYDKNGTKTTSKPSTYPVGETVYTAKWTVVPAIHQAPSTYSGQTEYVDTVGTGMYIKMSDFKVTFDKNCSDSSVSTDHLNIGNVSYGNTIAQPAAANNPTRAGYTFGGWYTTSACTTAFNFSSTKITGNTTLYAKWTATKKKLKASVATGDTGLNSTLQITAGGSGVTTGSSVDVACGATVTITATATSGHKFGKWEGLPGNATGSNAGTVTFTMPEQDVTITAYSDVYSSTFTLTYDYGAGTAPAGGNPATYTASDSAITLKNPTPPAGYSFKGWSGTGLTGDSNTTVSIPSGSSGNRSYTANYTANKYQVVYSANGATTSTFADPSAVTTYSSSASITMPSNNTAWRTGYRVTNWISNKSASTKYTPGASCTLANLVSQNNTTYNSSTGVYTITLNAEWTANSYTVQYANGAVDGSNSVTGGSVSDTATYSYTDSVTLKSNSFTNLGYTFTKWNVKTGTAGTESAGKWAAGSVSVADLVAEANTNAASGDKPTNNASGNVIKIYANWKPNTYSISYAVGTTDTAGNAFADSASAGTAPAGSGSFTYTQMLTSGKTIAAKMGNTLGYTNAGWSLVNSADSSKNNGSYAGSSALTLTKSNFTTYFNGYKTSEALTLTAKWTEKNIKITYDKNASSATYTSGGAAKSDTKAYTASLTLPDKAGSNITYNGMNLDGWLATTGATSTITASTPKDVVNAVVTANSALENTIKSATAPEITIYAKWSNGNTSYTIYYYYQVPGADTGGATGTNGGEYPQSNSAAVTGKTGTGTTGSKINIDKLANGAHAYNGYSYVKTTGGDSGEKTLAGSGNEYKVYYKLQLTVAYASADTAKGTVTDASRTFDWGASLTAPTTTSKDLKQYRFGSWSASSGAPSVGQPVKDKGYTLTANWEDVKYSVSYGLYAGTTDAMVTLPDAISNYTYTQISNLACGTPTAKTGYKFDTWHKAATSGAGDGTANSTAKIIDALFNGGSADGQDKSGTLYAKMTPKTYTVKLWKFGGMASGDEMLSGNGGTQFEISATYGSTFNLPAAGDLADASKVFGYVAAGFGAKNGATDFYHTIGAQNISVADMVTALGDHAEDAPYNLTAKWNVVYSIYVPDTSTTQTMTIDAQNKTGATGDVTIKSATPKAMKMGAYCNVESSNLPKAKALFLGNKNANASGLNGVKFVFKGIQMPINGGSGTKQTINEELAAATGASDTNWSGLTGPVTLSLTDPGWNTLATALNTISNDSTELNNLGVTKSGTALNWGAMAKITWYADITSAGDTEQASNAGVGTNVYGYYNSWSEAN